MIEFRKVEVLEEWQRMLFPEKERGPYLSGSWPIYEASRGRPLGLLGVYSTMLLDYYGVLWFQPYDDLMPTRQDIRAAKKVNLTELFDKTYLATVREEDRKANNFARFFGLVLQGNVSNYNIYGEA